jgi:hypothetical protein
MKESLPDQPEKTYEFEDWCMRSMHDGRPEPKIRKKMLGEAPRNLESAHVRQVVEFVWMWAGLKNPPRAASDGRLGEQTGRNYTDHGDFGENAVVVRPDAKMRTVLHECAHAILRRIGLNSSHSPTFRKLVLDLYDAALPGFEIDRLEAKAIADGLNITVDWTFDIDNWGS